jgi:hypothetical protein
MSKNNSQFSIAMNDPMGNPYRVGDEIMDLRFKDKDRLTFFAYGVKTVEDYVAVKQKKKKDKSFRWYRRTTDELKKIGYEKLKRKLFPPSTSSPNKGASDSIRRDNKYENWVSASSHA